jgi:hypothetical protein
MRRPHAPERDPALRRLAYGVLLTGFRGPQVPDWLWRACDEGLGGVVYFAGNLGPHPALGAAQLRLRAQLTRKASRRARFVST